MMRLMTTRYTAAPTTNSPIAVSGSVQIGSSA